MNVHVDLSCRKCRRRFGLQVDITATEVACPHCGASVDVAGDLAALRRLQLPQGEPEDQEDE